MSNIKVVDKIEKENNTENVTLFLGNGFDLNMGLKTSYEDFVLYYLYKVKSDNLSVIKLKQLLETEVKKENWCDLELLIGKLTSEFTDVKDFYTAFCDIGKELLNYLTIQEIKFEEKTDLEKNSIAHNFMDDILILLMHYRTDKNIIINILTFNYTIIIDKLVSIIKENSELNNFLNSKNITIEDIIHCHGSYKTGKICFGLNDESQVKNVEMFDNNYRYIQQIIKPSRNKCINQKSVKDSDKIIFASDLIVNYGCSFGKTDKYWLELLTRWLGGIYSHFINNKPDYEFIRNDITNNRFLWVYSHTRRPESMFDADTLEFEDRIKEKYSYRDDDRIKIKYDNVFENMKNILK